MEHLALADCSAYRISCRGWTLVCATSVHASPRLPCHSVSRWSLTAHISRTSHAQHAPRPPILVVHTLPLRPLPCCRTCVPMCSLAPDALSSPFARRLLPPFTAHSLPEPEAGRKDTRPARSPGRVGHRQWGVQGQSCARWCDLERHQACTQPRAGGGIIGAILCWAA